MAKDRDILMSDGDVMVKGCDLATGDTLEQNVAMMLELEKGELKQYPTMGVGIGGMVADEDRAYWNREIRETLKADGMKVETLSMDANGESIHIKARY